MSNQKCFSDIIIENLKFKPVEKQNKEENSSVFFYIGRLIGLALLFCIKVTVVYLAWNKVISPACNFHNITYSQAMFLFVLIDLF